MDIIPLSTFPSRAELLQDQADYRQQLQDYPPGTWQHEDAVELLAAELDRRG